MKHVNLKSSIDILHKSVIEQHTNEHIIPDGLGADFTIEGAIDKKTNNTLGGSIDGDLVSQMAPFRSFLGLKTSRGGEIPLTSADGTIDMRGDTPSFNRGKGAPWTLSFDGDKLKSLQIEAKTQDQAASVLPHMLRANKITPEQVKITSATLVRENVGTVPIATNFGGGGFFRSIAKTSFMALASLSSADLVLGNSFDAIRTYIVSGKEPEHNADICCWDYRTGVKAISQHLSETKIFHEIALLCDPQSGVSTSVVTLFGCLRVSCLLTNTWEGPSLRKCFSVDLLKKDNKHRITDEPMVDLEGKDSDYWLGHAMDVKMMGQEINIILGEFDTIRKERYVQERMREMEEAFRRCENGEITGAEFLHFVDEVLRKVKLDMSPAGSRDEIPLNLSLADLLRKKNESKS